MRLTIVDENITLMPHALIKIRRKCSEAEEVAMLEAVHAALVSAFRIPPHDKHMRLLVHEPHRCVVPPTLTHPELHTLVSH